MNESSNQPQNPANRKPRRRRRNFGSNQSQGGQQGQGRQGGGQSRNNRNHRNNRGGQRRNNVFVGPMDHSYRNQSNGGGAIQGRYRNGQGSELEPLPPSEGSPTKIFAFIDDLFFLAKIQEIGRKLNVKVEFVKSEKDIVAKAGTAPDDAPSLVIVDLNSNSIKPLSVIAKLKSKFKKSTSILGFVSHVQGDLKLKAQEAGCDAVMPRSAFSQNLPNLLRRHAAPDEAEDNFNRA